MVCRRQTSGYGARVMGGAARIAGARVCRIWALSIGAGMNILIDHAQGLEPNHRRSRDWQETDDFAEVSSDLLGLQGCTTMRLCGTLMNRRRPSHP